LSGESDGKTLSADARRDVAKLNPKTLPSPEQVTIPWQPFPSTSPERNWAWNLRVIDPAGMPPS
jgi:hypothetical protein